MINKNETFCLLQDYSRRHSEYVSMLLSGKSHSESYFQKQQVSNKDRVSSQIFSYESKVRIVPYHGNDHSALECCLSLVKHCSKK